ncbi:peptidase associated/transthyretin-like domain-containing protein [Blastopirellula retiformator]|nr:carboxypeptidase regulatory-like domain-containing protein [Blastopirellula retiformator]
MTTLILTASVAVCFVGCSGNGNTPPLGEVSGHVTLNGAPLDGATVEFDPENGRPSIGVTDADGNYTLQFRAGASGALVGKHSVRIRSQRSASGGEGSEAAVAARSETVPSEYNDDTNLSAEVKSGSNTFDFNLEGKRSKRAAAGA